MTMYFPDRVEKYVTGTGPYAEAGWRHTLMRTPAHGRCRGWIVTGNRSASPCSRSSTAARVSVS